MEKSILLDPADLATVPVSFFDSLFYKGSNSLKDPEELIHFRCIVATFLNYAFNSVSEFNKLRDDFASLTLEQIKLLKIHFNNRHKALLQCLNINHAFFLKIVEDYLGLFDFSKSPNTVFIINSSNRTKIVTLLRQFNREWGSCGEEERKQSFSPILTSLKELYKERKGVRVLVPGCGLGRLPFEIAKLGFDCQGNEFSYFMLLSSDFILNRLTNPITIYPFLHKFRNNKRYQKNFLPVIIPDKPLTPLPDYVDFSMTAGEFIEVYREQKNQWDVVVTCFFIDTAKNVFDYVDVIYEILREGGHWINLGPLLYHYTEHKDEISVEVSVEELKYYIEKKGFEFLKEDWVKCKYCSEPDEMLESIYNCWNFLCIKENKQ